MWSWGSGLEPTRQKRGGWWEESGKKGRVRGTGNESGRLGTEKSGVHLFRGRDKSDLESEERSSRSDVS